MFHQIMHISHKIQVAVGILVHHTVEGAVPDSHRVPFSMLVHHYIYYCIYPITDRALSIIDIMNVYIGIIYDPRFPSFSQLHFHPDMYRMI